MGLNKGWPFQQSVSINWWTELVKALQPNIIKGDFEHKVVYKAFQPTKIYFKLLWVKNRWKSKSWKKIK